MCCKQTSPVPLNTAVHSTTSGPNLLGEGTPAVPSKEGAIRIIMKQGAFTSRSGGNICTPQNTPYAGGLYVKGKRTFMMQDKMVLCDGNDRPIAVCIRQVLNFEHTFRIYSFRPIIPNQAPSSRQTHKGQRLYRWAEIKDLGFGVKYTMAIWNGTSFVPQYRTHNVAPQTVAVTTTFGKKCVVKVQQRGQESWDITIAPRIDPCLIICLVAVMDETQEE